MAFFAKGACPRPGCRGSTLAAIRGSVFAMTGRMAREMEFADRGGHTDAARMLARAELRARWRG
jgi:hypothetical protein